MTVGEAMAYTYSDPKRATKRGALPNVEVFHVESSEDLFECEWYYGEGWYYAYGFPGCLWDSEPVGPFVSEALATIEVVEDAIDRG